MAGTAQIMQGDALHLPLDDASVDLICTSPPYFGLRSYQDGGVHFEGQLGSEATPAEFVDALIAATREMVRVLKPSGSIWVNLGDKYASTSTPGPQSQNSTMTGGRHKGVDAVLPRRLTPGAPHKSLIGIPWRYAIRCIDELGLILRAEVIWSKPNGLPESVTDRVRRSHEQWFHMVKNPRYYSAVDEIREDSWNGKNGSGARSTGRTTAGYGLPAGHQRATASSGLTVGQCSHIASPTSCWSDQSPTDYNWTTSAESGTASDTSSRSPSESTSSEASPSRQPTQPRHTAPTDTSTTAVVCAECACGHELEPATTGSALGSLPGSVWQVPTQPLRVPPELGVDHFAAFPMEFPRRIIRGWSPSGICVECGEGRRPVVDKRYLSAAQGYESAGRWGLKGQAEDTPLPTRMGDGASVTITGEACACPEPSAPTRPSVILDPFGGTGTTALVAKALGRHGISLDMSADYCRLAQWRTNDEGELARALEVDKPAQQVEGQWSLLDLIDEEVS